MMKKFIIIFGSICLTLNLIFIYTILDQISISDERFLDLKTCPYCYGFSICNELEFKDIRHNKYNIIFEEQNNLFNTYFMQNILNIKNVFFAIDLYTGQRMVIKKLAHYSELEEFDTNENECKNNQNTCLNKFIHNHQDLLENRLDEDSLKMIAVYLEIDYARCFSQRLINLMYEAYYKTKNESIKNRKKFLVDNLILITTLKINPEPINLQMFPKENGWPFPKYFGSCGRIIVESYEEKTIDKYFNSPFSTRIKIARRLIQTLIEINENQLEIGIYFLDLGYENISYNEENDKIYFIDAENIFLVDKLRIKKDKGNQLNQSIYTSEFDDCGGYGDCLNFDLNQMCNSYYVDLNFYSACRNLLSLYASDYNRKNFLHSIPNEINKIYKLEELLNECSTLNRGSKNRFEIANYLIFVFDQILNHLNK